MKSQWVSISCSWPGAASEPRSATAQAAACTEPAQTVCAGEISQAGQVKNLPDVRYGPAWGVLQVI